MGKKTALILLFIIFLLGIFLRCWYLFPDRLIFGYDQVIDTILARKIIDYHDLIIFGVNNMYGLNHGVLFTYFTAIPYLLGGGNPIVIAYWYIVFNALSIVSVFIFSYSLFKDWPRALSSSFIVAVSYQMILMAGWISNTTVALYLMPMFFLGFWLYKNGRDWGLILTAFLLGLLIQSQMLMVYNLVVILVIWLVFKLRWPKLRTVFLSVFSFLLAVSTMVLVEIRTNFSSVRALLNPTQHLAESNLPFVKRLSLFGQKFLLNFSLNLTPQNTKLGMVLGIVILLIVVVYIFRRKTRQEEKRALILLLIFLLAPICMLAIGYHDTPWTLIGMVPAISIATGYTVSKIPSFLLKILLLYLLFYLNVTMAIDSRSREELFINQEPLSTLKGQLAVIDYTFKEAEGEEFAINAVSYPLYQNTYWSYHCPWYGEKTYGYLPKWLGGDQLYPFDTLPKSLGEEHLFYMLIDETKAISEVYKKVGKQWGYKYGKLLEERLIGGFTVQKFQKYN